MAVDQVFTCAAENDLSSDADLRIFFETDRGLLLVAVIEDDCYARFCYSGLSTLVDQILHSTISISSPAGGESSTYLEILCADRSHIRNTQNKTYRVENITLSTSIEARN